MEFITVEEMRALEANADYFGVSYGELMENAGKSVADRIMARYSPCKTLVVCGKGNNGGDGFVVARYLSAGSFDVSVLLLGDADDVKKGPAAENLIRLLETDIDVIGITAPDKLQPKAFDGSRLIVDAILGTGARGVPKGLERKAIHLINRSRAVKISVDVPSGLDCQTGICEICVKPDLVITFHAPKKGLGYFNYEAVDIGIPEKALTCTGPGAVMIIKTRGDFDHKGENGRVLVIGGGPYTGAPALVALAALRAGAGWVTVAAPQRAADIIASYTPDIITVPLSDRHKIVEADLEILAPLIAKHDVTVIGNGAGSDPDTLAALAKIIPRCDKAIIDADALQPAMPLRGIITPHPGEFLRISGFDATHNIPDQAVKKFSADRNVVTLLKSRKAVISDGKRIMLNSTGNAGMAVGGTGDVLAGITGAFYCRNEAFDAAASAAFVSGAAGDMAFQDKGYWITATDVIEHIPYVMKKYRLGNR